MYTITKNNEANSHDLNNHTVVIYGIWHDDGLNKAIKAFTKEKLESLTSIHSRPLFKLRILPEKILNDEEFQLEIQDNQEYNSVYLTTSRKYLEIDKETKQTYQSTWHSSRSRCRTGWG